MKGSNDYYYYYTHLTASFSIFTGRMLFPMPSQQRQSTEGVKGSNETIQNKYTNHADTRSQGQDGAVRAY